METISIRSRGLMTGMETVAEAKAKATRTRARQVSSLFELWSRERKRSRVEGLLLGGFALISMATAAYAAGMALATMRLWPQIEAALNGLIQ